MGAIVIVLLITLAHYQTGRAKAKPDRSADVYAQVARIRAARKARFRGRR